MRIYEVIQEAPMSYGQEGKPEWFDRAVQLKLNNPRITALEIAKQVGTTVATVLYWLTGKEQVGRTMSMIDRPKDSFPFEIGDFPLGKKRYYDGAKPEWYNQALQMAKAGETFKNIAKKVGVTHVTVAQWLVKGRKDNYGKLVNPDAEIEPRRIRGQKLDLNLLTSFIKDGYTDEEIIDLIIDDKGPKIASQVRTMLPDLRKKLNPGTQVIDKSRTGSMRDPDITGLVQQQKITAKKIFKMGK